GEKIVGWTRYDAGKTMELNWEGMVVAEKDARGRCVTGQQTSYVREGEANPRVRPDTRPLKMVLGNQLAHHVFADDNDLRGRAARSFWTCWSDLSSGRRAPKSLARCCRARNCSALTRSGRRHCEAEGGNSRARCRASSRRLLSDGWSLR